MPTTTYAYGDRIRLERLKYRLLQEDVAGALGISHAALSRYENGHRMPRHPVEFEQAHAEAVALLSQR